MTINNLKLYINKRMKKEFDHQFRPPDKLGKANVYLAGDKKLHSKGVVVKERGIK